MSCLDSARVISVFVVGELPIGVLGNPVFDEGIVATFRPRDCSC